MQLVERHILDITNYSEMIIKAKELYNQSLYYWRQSIFKNIQYFTEYELINLFTEFNEPTYRALPIQSSQQIIKSLFNNVNSWQKSRQEYLKNPTKFLGKPKMPNYKSDTYIVIFTNQQLKLKDGYINFPKKVNLPPLKTKVNNICQVRIIPNSNHVTIEVVYLRQEKQLKDYNGNWMGIDLGMNNIASCITNKSASLFNGKPLKAINHFYNKIKAKLQSKLQKGKFNTKRINRLTKSRNHKIENYIHQISNKIIKQAQKEDITKIIIGNNKKWKQGINLGKNTNRNFVSIPHSTLIDKIKYKGLLEGIEVVITQEAYTSKCSALDLEPIKKHTTYLGKRVKRGLFKTANGIKINADINGSLNIARLVAGDEIISDSVRSIVSMPHKITFFNKNENIN